MRLMRFTTGVALSALIATSAAGQTAPQTPPTQERPQTPPAGQAAGRVDPAATAAPRAPRMITQSEFKLADGIIATVNDQIITGFDLRQRMLILILMSNIQPTEENIGAIQQEALNALIDERLQAEELRRYEDLVVSDEEVDAEIAGMAEGAGLTGEQYMAVLEQSGIRPSTFREQIRVGIGWRQLVGGRFSARARVGRAQVEQRMRQDAEAAAKPAYQIGEIYIDAARVGGMQQAVNGARQLIQQMIQGAPFQAVATQFSSAPSAIRGGDAGWVVQGTVQPALQQAFDNLQVGELSNPIVVDGGVYIIYMRDKRDGSAATQVSLKQVMVELPENATPEQVSAASSRLTSLQPQLTCDNMIQRATSEQGLLGSDLGESDVRNLAPQFQQVAASGAVGSVSGPVRTPLGLHLVGVCGRRLGGPQAPTYEQVERRMQTEGLSLLGRRYIRDLRADALIEMK